MTHTHVDVPWYTLVLGLAVLALATTGLLKTVCWIAGKVRCGSAAEVRVGRGMLLAVAGAPETGRKTVARYLADEHGLKVYSIDRYAERVVSGVTGVPVDQMEVADQLAKMTALGKTVKQLLGDVSDALWAVHPNIFNWMVLVEWSEDGYPDAIIEDVETQDEIDFLTEKGARVVVTTRPGQGKNRLALSGMTSLQNDGDLDALREKADDAFRAVVA